MSQQPKDEVVRARISREMKKKFEELAQQRGEAESVIVREALVTYLKSQEKTGTVYTFPESKAGMVAEEAAPKKRAKRQLPRHETDKPA
jgi:predicted transcriptional regulator